MENASLPAEICTDEERARNRQALLLLCLSFALILVSVFLAFYKADPRGEYVLAYRISETGHRENADPVELHLKSDGVATYVTYVNTDSGADTKIKMNGRWKKKSGKIIVTFQGEQMTLRRSGNQLIETLENGEKTVFIKD